MVAVERGIVPSGVDSKVRTSTVATGPVVTDRAVGECRVYTGVDVDGASIEGIVEGNGGVCNRNCAVVIIDGTTTAIGGGGGGSRQ